MYTHNADKNHFVILIISGDYSGSLMWEHTLSNVKTNSSSTTYFKMMSRCHS